MYDSSRECQSILRFWYAALHTLQAGISDALFCIEPTLVPEIKPECVLSDYQAATLDALQRSWKTSH
jgi:hypothetical protein